MRSLFALALLVATPAFAQGRTRIPTPESGSAAPIGASTPQQPAFTVIVEPVAMMIAAFDADGDGKVTRAEFDTGLKRSFDAVDTQHQGWLGYIAYSDWQERWMGDRNTVPSPFEVDRDGDNKVSFAELVERFDLLFKRFDADRNGVIERKELVTIRPQVMMGPGMGRGKKGRGPN
ncbi:EF-hand domain-containing protein [Nostoc ellipsosporum NOK]|uniref:EF-hand domain-containing protein n=1 Tax=Sphingomonas sp. IBVSS2 TaxID=1985172 RepID=UPI000A2D992C|nr:EF-hand domain-containing protein [Sphingomonas sp. IBVSS2]MDF2384596.1 EF-hand domain-containing protein [Nostoc ellipsosporum NOK]OSZ68200.1 calcium-binding protein [Sphingomonas sp. IBVSS2]